MGAKARKGYVIHVGETELKTGINNLPEALYLVRRYYNHPPHSGDVVIEINGRVLYRYNRAIQKEELDMSVFSNFRDELKAAGQEMDKIPSLKEVDRLLLIKSHVPFRLVSASPVDGKFGTQVAYELKVDVTSKEFNEVNASVQLVGGEYTLWTKATSGRLRQLELLKPFIQDLEAGNPGTALCLVGPNGREWDFDVYTSNTTK